MTPFTSLIGVAAPLPLANVDTDAIMPKQFLKTVRRTGLGSALFHDMRYGADGTERPDFVLNQAPYRNASILIAGANFGCGSSREHAPWGLLDFGIRCVLAPTFADIFAGNCVKNGILCAELSPAEVDRLTELAREPSTARMTVDLAAQVIETADGRSTSFGIDDMRKETLLSGLDEITLTLRQVEGISRFEMARVWREPWRTVRSDARE